MSLYRTLTPAELLAKIAAAKAGVTQNAGGDRVTPANAVEATPEMDMPDSAPPPGSQAGGQIPECSPSAERRSKNRHKPSQAEYMRAYRARKKAEKEAR